MKALKEAHSVQRRHCSPFRSFGICSSFSC
nr:MAG TPA: hypothetical protein [Caudoviricetes sp.]